MGKEIWSCFMQEAPERVSWTGMNVFTARIGIVFASKPWFWGRFKSSGQVVQSRDPRVSILKKNKGFQQSWKGRQDSRIMGSVNEHRNFQEFKSPFKWYDQSSKRLGAFVWHVSTPGSPQVVYSSSPYTMPGAASVSAMPMTSYTTAPMAFSA